MSNNPNYRFSRLSTFGRCPRKHHYIYEEGLPEPEDKHLLAGTLFHQMIELHYKGEDTSPVLKQYRAACASGVIDEADDLLEYVFDMYVAHYAKKDAKEKIIAIEHNTIQQLEDEDIMSSTIDRIVEMDDGTYRIRDTKTTFGPLKYSTDMVRYHQQLLWYVAVAESDFPITIDAIEIDEVRLAKLENVPLNQNGKPTADKKKLGLVTYENYYNTLSSMGLANAPEYQHVLDWLEKRGHPLFQRVTVQLLDRNIIQENLNDLFDLYRQVKVGSKARVRGPLCNYCGFKELCELDYYMPMESDRQIYIEKLTKK